MYPESKIDHNHMWVGITTIVVAAMLVALWLRSAWFKLRSYRVLEQRIRDDKRAIYDLRRQNESLSQKVESLSRKVESQSETIRTREKEIGDRMQIQNGHQFAERDLQERLERERRRSQVLSGIIVERERRLDDQDRHVTELTKIHFDLLHRERRLTNELERQRMANQVQAEQIGTLQLEIRKGRRTHHEERLRDHAAYVSRNEDLERHLNEQMAILRQDQLNERRSSYEKINRTFQHFRKTDQSDAGKVAERAAIPRDRQGLEREEASGAGQKP